MSDRLFIGSKYEQMAFGRRKPLVQAGARPMPRWTRIDEEKRREAKVRTAADEMKRIIFRTNPDARIWSIYGNAMIDGARQKFSFDVLWDEHDYSPMQIYEAKKAAYDRLYKGEIPRNYYYQFYMSPNLLLRGRWRKHDGIVEIGQISKRKGFRGRFESWRPMSRSVEKERELTMKQAAALRQQERLVQERRMRLRTKRWG